MIFSYGRRIGKPIAGGCAGMIVYLSPLVGIDGVSANNDVALATAAFRNVLPGGDLALSRGVFRKQTSGAADSDWPCRGLLLCD